MKIAFYTLGCKTNQYETQAMERLAVEMGHTLGDFHEDCDGYVINTCSVTAVADKKNRGIIRRCRREHPEAVIGVCGCYPQHAAAEVKALGADVVGGSGDRRGFLEEMAGAVRGQYRERLDVALRRRTYEDLPAGGLRERTRALLKVQDGCVNFCSYCIIPYTRGPIRSATVETAVRETEALAEAGYREIVITGIEIASWGADLPGRPPVTELITEVCRAAPEVRFRLGSLEPRIVTEEFCESLSVLPNLCPQFHLSMQSGCDTVLRRMNRKYDCNRYLESLRLLRETFPDCAVTTDMIVGFPGETEEEFGESLRFIRRCGFADMHIFPYSRRPGTPADKMPGQLPNAVKERRSREAIAVGQEMNRAYRENMIGKTQRVLFETGENGLWSGHGENYIRVYARGENLHNKILPVTVTALCDEGVLGELSEEGETEP